MRACPVGKNSSQSGSRRASAAWTSHSGGLSISDRSNARSVIAASGVRSMAMRREQWFNAPVLERSTRMETGT
jgi:hypothetical protein